MPVHVAGERLLAVVDDLHRAVRVQREQRAVHLHRQVLAPAERAADAGEVDAHLLERQPEARRDLRAVDVQPLRRDVDVDAALAVRHREPGLRPEERLILDPDLVVRRSTRHVARSVGVAVADHHVAHDVRRGRPRGSRGRASASPDAGRPARSRAPCRRPARAARTRRGCARRRGAPARDARRRRARPARRGRGRGRSPAPAGRRTRARRSSGPGRPRASAPRGRRASTPPRRCRSSGCARARAGCAACAPRASPERPGRSRTRTRPSPSAARRPAGRARRPCRPAAGGRGLRHARAAARTASKIFA